uniref:Very short patch repair endonuclease n=1 Tax=Candidatus Kentrum sp. TC TaxID=2126339 RepID=A0A451A9Y8_9GAMM|nr:MAG: DNA mismatch endonuclease, patch repair protein [Candidatus Kentron sp. TC]
MRHDPLTPEQRAERMSRIRSADTKPELKVRRLTHAMGYRYRLRARDVPGRPDMVFRRIRKVIFVHGCFWHQHGCRQYRMPKTRLEFWLPKLEKNVERDNKVSKDLREFGWEALVIWECQLKDIGNVRDRIKRFLEGK